MDEQIKQAVEIAIGGTADFQLKQQAIQFLNDLKNSPDGWQAFALLLKDVNNNDQVRFVALQALCDYIPTLQGDSSSYIRSTLLEYLQSLISANKYDPAFLKNKLAEAFAASFCATYLTSWTCFFTDFHQLIKNENEIAVDQYVRVLLAIHSEIGDQLIIRERTTTERNNNLKDAIRVSDMADLALVWKRILTDFRDRSSTLTQEILKGCLQVIGAYVSWIEISLIIPSDYINTILQFLNKEGQKSTCCITLTEIISKKMKPEGKLQLLSMLNLTSVVASLNIDSSDIDTVESVAKLYNSIGLELSYILDSSEATPDTKTAANESILAVSPFILNFLSNEYDDVSCQVFPFLSAFLTALKKLVKQSGGQISPTHMELLTTLLQKIIVKMKFDDDDDGEDEDTIQEFNEFRGRLRVFQDTIASTCPDIYMEQMFAVINQSIFESNGQDWRQVELGLYELTSFSDSLRQNTMNIPKQQIIGSKPYLMFQEMLLKTINSNVIQINHPLIHLLFFELIVRHYTLLNSSNNKDELTSHILNLFISLGLHNNNEMVQMRCWYLFFRFAKLTKPELNDNLIQELVTDLSQTLLVIEAELPQKDDDSELVEASSKFDNQLYLFETLGLLISLHNKDNISMKLKLMDMLFNPIFLSLQNIISSNDRSPKTILQAHHLLMAIGTIARGFEYDTVPNKVYNAEIIERFKNTAEVVLVTLENLSSNEGIRDAARFSFARFIPILKSSINTYLSRLISIILASNNLKFSELTDFLGFIGQIVHNFNKDDLIYQLLNDLFTPLSDKVFQMVNDKGENNVYELMPDIIREKSFLKKAYISLLIALQTNNVSSLLITETNKSNLPTILQSLLLDANNLEDLQVAKFSLTALENFTTIFGNDTVNDSKDKYATGLTIQGISSFLLENLVNLSFEIPFQNSKFDVKDAQYRFVVDELAQILKTLFTVKQQDLVQYLREIYFPRIQLPQNVGDDLIQNLANLDAKAFKKYFVQFVIQLKS
ncbi:LOS1 [Cyberlindnera jadinii]|uniref:Exportin-T n=1 Tax=Cyberlindnera jadinii (strain ATCC 18201 / CBS 1600 / BCRC 20928 / JCM 3617 / NBRC 0987 / NRRL Y-1542) TaxID=983966 RepID=A0A0H5BZI4_CYBJN|nr:LOS1 [Cyberlindnera jadinii]